MISAVQPGPPNTTTAVVHPSLLASSGRLTVAASVLGMARTFEASICTTASDPAWAGRTPSFDSAVRLYEDGRWADAFDVAAGRADAGDPRAAKLVLLMLRHGLPLYGVAFSVEPLRVARWARTVLQATAEAESASVRSETASGEVRRASAQRTPRSASRRTASPNSITAIA